MDVKQLILMCMQMTFPFTFSIAIIGTAYGKVAYRYRRGHKCMHNGKNVRNSSSRRTKASMFVQEMYVDDKQKRTS